MFELPKFSRSQPLPLTHRTPNEAELRIIRRYVDKKNALDLISETTTQAVEALIDAETLLSALPPLNTATANPATLHEYAHCLENVATLRETKARIEGPQKKQLEALEAALRPGFLALDAHEWTQNGVSKPYVRI